MPEYLAFDFKYAYKDSSDGIALETILVYGERRIQTEAKVDCGAECCVFRHEDGLNLGIDIFSGIPKRMGSLTGTLDTFGHEVTIQVEDIIVHSTVYFAKYPNLSRNLLGRKGWIRKLRFGLVDYDNTIYLSHYDS
jgi:hypothetical protein